MASGERSTQLQRWLAALLLAAAVVLVAPWRPTDPDVLANLAVGRLIVEQRAVPDVDPLTFAAPDRRWSNPEWLSDLLWYGAYRLGGDAGLLALKLTLLVFAFLLALRLAERRGAATSYTVALLLVALLGAGLRLTERNDVHAYWLVPLYGLVLARATERRAWGLALVPLAVLWANLHSSFVLGWGLVLAALLQAVVDRAARRDLALLGMLLAMHPLLGLVSPHGLHNYDQLLDHLRGAAIYRDLIVEWQPATRAHPLAQLPLHLLAAFGLLSFLPHANRRQIRSLVLLLLAVALGYSSQRFIPLAGLMIAPALAANLTRWIDSSTGTSARFRCGAAAALLLVALGLLAPVIVAARTHGAPHVLQRPDAPRAAARLLGAVPAGTRLFSPFNAGPWLLWEARPVRLYIDPRNTAGAAALQRYATELLPRPERFEAEVRRLDIALALVDRVDRRFAALEAHLASSSAWRRMHLDERFALYTRAGVGRSPQPPMPQPQP